MNVSQWVSKWGNLDSGRCHNQRDEMAVKASMNGAPVPKGRKTDPELQYLRKRGQHQTVAAE